MEISLVFQEHPDDDIWEEYAFGRVSPQQEPKLEEHLLACERCQKVVAGTEEYVRAMKFATAHFAERIDARPQWGKVFPFARGVGHPLPRAGIASAVATACLVLLLWVGSGSDAFSRHRVAPANSVEVSLKSLRGGDEALNHAPAGHPLDLSIANVPASPEYRCEIVTAAGASAWSGPAAPRDGGISAHISQSLHAGTYWVRLYGPRDELLVEYGLKLD